MYLRKEEIFSALSEALKLLGEEAPQAIVARSDARSSKLEGLPAEVQLARGELPSTGVFAWEGQVRFPVDVIDGQKTGFIFDQRENRRIWQKFLQQNPGWSKTVGDVFCHLGGWGFSALMAGAEKVFFIDQSDAVLETVKIIAAENKWHNKIECISGDANEIKTWEQLPKFSALAVDPPAYIQSKKNLNAGLRAYRQLNQKALQRLNAGGLFSTSTCSHHCSESEFEESVAAALAANKRDAQLAYRGYAAFDHPAIAAVKESRYLKNLLFRVN
jgi:23S rRNA (cytosine1962-C5)-methyltransferase